MRQMKRALSLVLTMVMLLGMFMIPTNAASNFTDAELIENTEAVAITSGIGLFAGTTDGRFAPKATVTRAQMATIIVKMLRGNEFNADAFKGVDKFPDTASFEGGWAEGYINACVQMGVVAGYGDGTFKPGRELTTAEAITMIINALGIDPGPGEWPINYMAKAEALKLYGDLAAKPATDEPLNRDQLAVIVWEGLQYSPEGKSGYKVPGSDLIFTDIADAVLANGNRFEGITEAVGQDSLASKVYEIKTATGWVTGNAATGEPCTVLTSASGEDTNYAIETSVDMLGHYVTVYYNEQYKNDEDPGEVYTIIDESTVITVAEEIDTAKEYKAAFGKNINEAQNGLLLDSNYAVTEKLSNNMNISGYTAGSRAPKGTYIVVDGVIVTYIEPVAVYASYIVDIGAVEDEETIWINGANGDAPIPNTEGDDQVVEYSGIKVNDYVTYVVVNGVYVLSPVTKVVGTVTKTAATEVNGEEYNTITIDGTAYPAFEAKGTSPSNIFVGQMLNNDLSAVEYGRNYILYVASNGHYIGFESSGSTVSTANTLFLLGSVTIKEKDQYGKTSFVTKARGVDLGGSEIMLVTGTAKDTNSNGQYDAGIDETLGDMSMVLQGYYSFEESTDKEEKKEGIHVLTAYPGAYSPETPTYAIKAYTTNGTFTGTSSIATSEGIAAFPQSTMKVLVIDGAVNDSAPLTVSTQLPSGYVINASERDHYILVTRSADGARSFLEAFTFLSNAVIGEDVYFRVTQEQVDAPSRTADGTGYTVYDAATGKESEIIINPDYNISLTAPGMYRGTEDSDGLIVAINNVTPSTTATFTDGQPQVVSNIGFWGLTSTRLRGERLASANGVKIDMITGWNNNASSAVVVDLRTEEEIKASGVGKIASLAQLTTMRENDPGLIVIYDLYIEDNTTNNSGTTKTVFVTRAIRRTVGMNSIVYAMDDPTSGDTMIFTRGLNGNLGEEVKVDFEVCKNAGPGFYRFSVDADGKLVLLPFDTDTVSTGNYGMIAMHDTITKVVEESGTLKVFTENGAHTCSVKCADTGVEPVKEFYVTNDTQIWDNVDGKWITLDQFKTMQVNYDLSVDYYCDTPVYNSTAPNKDDSAEMLIITAKNFVPTSCDGSCQSGTPVASAADITGSGKYYLTTDLSSLTISSGNVELCLNGHSINGAATVSGGQLTMTNCEGRSGGDIAGGLKVNGGKAIMDDAVFAAGVTVAASGNFEMVGGAVRGASSSGVTNAGTFTMSGGIISGNTATNGGGVLTSGTFEMSGGTITGNTATSGGGVYVQDGGQLILSDSAAITGNTAKTDGGGVRVAGGGTVTMNGGRINNNTGTTRGGGVILEGTSAKQAVMTMNDGQINGNVTSHYGGGVSLRAYNKFTMNGGTIAGNMFSSSSNKFGTQISIGNNVGSNTSAGNFIMNGGTIDNADAGGYAAPVLQGTATIKGGTIIGELGTVGALGSTANLIVEGGTFNGSVTKGVLTLPSGTVRGPETLTITGGTFNGDVANATISGICELNGTVNDSVFTGGTISGSWTVGTNVTINSGTFVGKTVADLANATIAEGLSVEQVGSNVEIKYAFKPIDSSKTEPCAGTLHGLSITEGSEIYGGANYYLGANITGGLTVSGSGDVSLCLNGHTITTSGTAAITVGNGVTLHLCNCQTAGNVKGGGAGSALTISGGTVNMYDNVHMDGGTYSAQGAVTLSSRATFTMNGGTISNNTVTSPATGALGTYAGGIYLNSGTVNLYGGAISGNSASSRTYAHATANTSAYVGGGVAVEQGTLNIAGTAIYGNYAFTHAQKGGGSYTYSYAGGGVCLASGTPTLNMTGGIVAGNWAEADALTYKIAAGGIYIHNNQTANISGGIIGGDTKVEVSDGQPTNLGIGTGNYSPIGGGGIAARGTVKLSGNAVVKGNTGYFGGVEIYRVGTRVLNLSGNAAITNNTATYRGGGVYCEGGTVTIADNAAVSNNVSSQDGGGICMNGGTITITGGSITNNEATGAANGGGGVCAIGTSIFNMSGGAITGNTSNKNGGGVHKGASATVNITGGTISDNMPMDKNF